MNYLIILLVFLSFFSPYFINISILGKNIKIPDTRATKAKINTAAEAVSFAILASGCLFGLTKSTNASIAELINSVDITSPNNIKHINHSKYDIFNNIPSAITVIQIITCINIFCSFLKA
jgi:hypothetical protein